MALIPIANGALSDASQIDQFVNLLTGVMNDQVVTLKGDATRSPGLFILDATNPAQQVAMKFFDAGTPKWQVGKDTDNSYMIYDLVNAYALLRAQPNGPVVAGVPTAAALQNIFAMQRAGVTKYGIGLTAGDIFAILNAAGSVAIMTLDNSGNFAVTGNISGAGITGSSITGTAIAGTSFDASSAIALPIGPTNATMIQIRGPKKSLLVATTLTAFAAGAQTMTAAQLLGGLITGVPTASISYTTDTATNLDSAIANVANGDTFSCTVINNSAGAFTIAFIGGTGVTLKGSTLAVAQNKTATLTFNRTGAAAWTCYISVSA